MLALVCTPAELHALSRLLAGEPISEDKLTQIEHILNTLTLDEIAKGDAEGY